MKIKPASDRQCRAARRCLEVLSSARELAKIADCPKLVLRIRLAITSCGGAIRHIRHRASRTDKLGRALTPWTAKPYGSSKNKPAEKPIVHAWQTRADLQ